MYHQYLAHPAPMGQQAYQHPTAHPLEAPPTQPTASFCASAAAPTTVTLEWSGPPGLYTLWWGRDWDREEDYCWAELNMVGSHALWTYEVQELEPGTRYCLIGLELQGMTNYLQCTGATE
jgi:hypothetical protein